MVNVQKLVGLDTHLYLFAVNSQHASQLTHPVTKRKKSKIRKVDERVHHFVAGPPVKFILQCLRVHEVEQRYLPKGNTNESDLKGNIPRLQQQFAFLSLYIKCNFNLKTLHGAVITVPSAGCRFCAARR